MQLSRVCYSSKSCFLIFQIPCCSSCYICTSVSKQWRLSRMLGGDGGGNSRKTACAALPSSSWHQSLKERGLPRVTEALRLTKLLVKPLKPGESCICTGFCQQTLLSRWSSLQQPGLLSAPLGPNPTWAIHIRRDAGVLQALPQEMRANPTIQVS